MIGNFWDLNGKRLGHSWENNRALMGNSRTLMGKFEDINGETLGQCLETPMTLMGHSRTLMGKFPRRYWEFSMTLMGKN